MEEPSNVNRRGQVVTVTVGIQLVITLGCLFVRLYMRWPWHKTCSKVDVLAVVASLLVVGNAILSFEMVSHGLGISRIDLDPSAVAGIYKLFLISQLLFYLGATCSFETVVEFMAQLLGRASVFFLSVVRGATVLWGLAGVVLIAILYGANPAISSRTAFMALNATGCALQLAIFVAAVVIIWPLQMTVSKRLTVLAGFGASFVVIAAMLVSIIVTPNPATNGDFTRSANNFVIVIQITIMFLMINSTAAPLLQIGRRLGAGNAGPIIGYTETATYRSSYARSGKYSSSKDAYELESVTRSKLASQNVQSTVISGGRVYGQTGRATQHGQSGRSGDFDGISVESDSSQKIIIQRTVQQEEWGPIMDTFMKQ